ncbi:MAG: hypothetical protein AAFV28_11170 [Cyanobacteria bacterium J06635_13]
MTKKRKSLDDSLASEFVFGGDKPETGATPTPDIEPEPEKLTTPEVEPTPVAPIEPKSDVKLSASSSLMDKLQVEAKEGTKRFTIDLRESVHRKLSILSARTGRSKADIIRMVLDDVLADVEE